MSVPKSVLCKFCASPGFNLDEEKAVLSFGNETVVSLRKEKQIFTRSNKAWEVLNYA